MCRAPAQLLSPLRVGRHGHRARWGGLQLACLQQGAFPPGPADGSNLQDSQRLCVHLMDRALERLAAAQGGSLDPAASGVQTVLGIFDLRGFTSANADWGFVRFLVDIFFLYYPKVRPPPARIP